MIKNDNQTAQDSAIDESKRSATQQTNDSIIYTPMDNKLEALTPA